MGASKRICLNCGRKMKQQFIGLLPTHIDGNVRMAGKYKLESEPCKSKIVTVSVEFRR